MDPRNGGDLLCSQEGVYSVPRRGRREGGTGYGSCPKEVGGGDPQDPLWVPAGRDDEEEQGCARALLPEDLPPVMGTPGPGEGTRPPGRTARTCWRLSTLLRTPCHIPRRAGRCVGGGRAATRGRDGGATGRPTSVGGGSGSPVGGRGRGAGSPCRASSAGPPATCRRGESRGRGRRR